MGWLSLSMVEKLQGEVRQLEHRVGTLELELAEIKRKLGIPFL